MAGNISVILDTAKTYLGDFTESRYSDLVLKKALVAAILAVSGDTGTDITYDASTETISPAPTNVMKNLLSVGVAMVLLVGEETSSALDTGGLSWKSGMASINFAGYHKSISTSGEKLKGLYKSYLDTYTITQAGIGESDFYDVADTDYVGVN